VLGALCGVMINLLSEVADDSACGVFGHHVRFHENEWKARSRKGKCVSTPAIGTPTLIAPYRRGT
jgi:hypothetical protein